MGPVSPGNLNEVELSLTKPLPSMEIGNLIHVFQNAGGEETRDDVRDGVTGMPDGHASWVFFLVVP